MPANRILNTTRAPIGLAASVSPSPRYIMASTPSMAHRTGIRAEMVFIYDGIIESGNHAPPSITIKITANIDRPRLCASEDRSHRRLPAHRSVLFLNRARASQRSSKSSSICRLHLGRADQNNFPSRPQKTLLVQLLCLQMSFRVIEPKPRKSLRTGTLVSHFAWHHTKGPNECPVSLNIV